MSDVRGECGHRQCAGLDHCQRGGPPVPTLDELRARLPGDLTAEGRELTAREIQSGLVAPREGERCGCGRAAAGAIITERFGRVPYCGVPQASGDDGLQDSTQTTPPMSAPRYDRLDEPDPVERLQAHDVTCVGGGDDRVYGALVPGVHLDADSGYDRLRGGVWVDLGTPCPVCAVEFGPHEHQLGLLVRTPPLDPESKSNTG